MKTILNILFVLLAFNLSCVVSWKLETFPNIASPECRSVESSRICDPDGILSINDIQSLNEAISTIEENVKSPCHNGHDSEDNKAKLEVAIVMIKQMYRSSADSYTSVEGLAEKYGRGIHDRWGVGDEKCGNGIVMFLSILDRSVYVSTGTGLQQILTSIRIEDVISDMKPFLRRLDYKEALLNGLETLKYHIERGPPNFFEKYSFFIVAAVMAIAVAMKVYWESGQRRQYAELRSHLSEIDRDRALALMGQYRCTSCPICLEDFQIQPPTHNENNENNDNNDNNDSQYLGNDGLPIKLLRCGHAFDQSCWNEWVSTGQGDVTKCPVCKEDIGIASNHSQQASTSTNNQQLPPQNYDENHGTETSTSNHTVRRNNAFSNSNNHQVNRLNRLYERERNFRLMRMMERYPRYLSRSQIDRWTGGNYDGRLVQDSEFVRRDPSAHHHQSSSSRGRSTYGRSSGFGGGRSGGGGGGSW